MKKISICLKIFLLFLLFVTIRNITAMAYTPQVRTELTGKWFYIKNGYSGKYLDVSGGVAANNTNVQQYDFNGSDAQKWYFHHLGNGEYMICSKVGYTTENGIDYLYYGLDVDNGVNANDVNVHLWTLIDGVTQRYAIRRLTDGKYVIYTKGSDFEKTVAVTDGSLLNTANVAQWDFTSQFNQMWILEPIDKNFSMGVSYAEDNVCVGGDEDYSSIGCYPKLGRLGGDCTNFVSQCMLSSGVHYQNDWFIYRSGGLYSSPQFTWQLNNSWTLSDPSPWISANEFKNYWQVRVTKVILPCEDYLEDASSYYMSFPYGIGDVIQYGEMTNDGHYGNAHHSMIISGFNSYNGSGNYAMTYHSTNRSNVNLIWFVDQMGAQNGYLIFYKMI